MQNKEGGLAGTEGAWEPQRSYEEELEERCLFESLEFLYKAGLAQDSGPVGRQAHRERRLERARNLFCMKEYYQASSVLQCPGRAAEKAEYVFCDCCDAGAVFLRNYSMYILSQIKQSGEKAVVLLGNERIEAHAINKMIIPSDRLERGRRETRKGFADKGVFSDPFLMYGLFLVSSAHLSLESKETLLLAIINRAKYFWGPYQLLVECVDYRNKERVISQIKEPLMRSLFILYASAKRCIKHERLDEVVRECVTEIKKSLSGNAAPCGQELRARVLGSFYAKSLVAASLSHAKNFKAALLLFQHIHQESFYHDSFDVFSNVLYTHGDTEKLSSLLLAVYDRFYNLPLYHYVVGNLLSLKENHVASIENFQKIVHEKRRGGFDIAYTLIAQEYFHLKDTNSAIKTCNVAIKKNYNDFRAWFNIAQIYFAIEMYKYSLHFYRKCIEMSSDDGLLYEGLGLCFEKLERYGESVRCYKKGIEHGSVSCIGLLGDIYYKNGNLKYITYYEMYLDEIQRGARGKGAAPEDALDQARGADEVSYETSERFLGALEKYYNKEIEHNPLQAPLYAKKAEAYRGAVDSLQSQSSHPVLK